MLAVEYNYLHIKSQELKTYLFSYSPLDEAIPVGHRHSEYIYTSIIRGEEKQILKLYYYERTV